MQFTMLLGLALLLSLQEVRGQFAAILNVNQAIDSEEISHGEDGLLQHDSDPPVGYAAPGMKIDYLTFTSAKCFKSINIYQCLNVARIDKTTCETIDSEVRPHGCYFMRAQNKYFFNERYTEENCTEERKCYCAKMKLFEGDIVDTPEVEDIVAGRTHEGSMKRDATTGGQWTGGIIRYMFERGHERLEGPVKNAIAEYTRQLGGCLKFYKYNSRASLANKGRKNYIVFFIGQGCYSSIGMTRGEQKISLGEGCTQRGTIMHEMMHALGFWHEQSRLDRDNYITIYTANVIPNMMHNFQKYKSNQASTLGASYDIDSVMHYPPTAFSRNGRPTIVDKRYGRKDFGWRDNLSKIDVQQLKKYYSCSGSTRSAKIGPKKVDGRWTSWKWGSCSKSCGGGRRTATRSCTNPSPSNGGRRCSGKTTYYAECNTGACPRKTACVNKNSNCVYWARSGNCRTRTYGSYMAKNCGSACGFC